MTLAAAGVLVAVGVAVLVVRRGPRSRWLGSVLVVLGALVVASLSVVVVPAGRDGVAFSAVSGVKPGTLGPGAHLLVPGVESATLYDSRLQASSLASDSDSNAPGQEGVAARSREGLQVSADVTVQFRLVRDRVADLHARIGPRYVETVVRPLARSKVRDVLGRYAALDLASTGRARLELEAAEALRPAFAEADLELVAVLLKDVHIPRSVSGVIEQKQVSEQQVAVERRRLERASIAAQRSVVEAQGDARATVALAEGEARALSLRGGALKGNAQLIQLGLAEKLAPSIRRVLLPSEGNLLLDTARARRP